VGGGNGGSCGDGDVGGQAGSYGLSLGDYTGIPNGTLPADSNRVEYTGNPGRGGRGGSTGSSGTSGYALLEFDVAGVYVNDNGSYIPVNKTYVNTNGVWTPVNSIWVKSNNVWNQVQGSAPPNFTSVSVNYGISPRDF
jgi:hypothetical protein